MFNCTDVHENFIDVDAGVQSQADAPHAARAHFGISVSIREVSHLFKRASAEKDGIGPRAVESAQVTAARSRTLIRELVGRPAEEPISAARRAVERIFAAPPLLDLADAVSEWPTEFVPSLGQLGGFIKSTLS